MRAPSAGLAVVALCFALPETRGFRSDAAAVFVLVAVDAVAVAAVGPDAVVFFQCDCLNRDTKAAFGRCS